MDKLSAMPAGEKVVFRRLVGEDELSLYDDDPTLYEIALEIREVSRTEDAVLLDGWEQ